MKYVYIIYYSNDDELTPTIKETPYYDIIELSESKTSLRKMNYQESDSTKVVLIESENTKDCMLGKRIVVKYWDLFKFGKRVYKADLFLMSI